MSELKLFFFSSRRRHTRYWRDWSSDVCSSDLYEQAREDPSYAINIPFTDLGFSPFEPSDISIPANMTVIWFNEDDRSEERREGKSVDLGGRRIIKKKKK